MRTQFAFFGAALCLLALAATAQANPDVYERAVRSTVLVFSLGEEGVATGSGALIDRERRLVVTNDHVVRGSKALAVIFPRFDGDNHVIADRDAYQDLNRLRRAGRLSKCRVVLRAPQRDLALLELDVLPDDVRALTLGERRLRPGERVHSIGNPGISGGFWVYTQGSVRQVYHGRFSTDSHELDARVVESDSSVNPGDSGGPVVNDRGELVAIVQSIHAQREGGLVNRTSLFIEVSEVKALVRRLRDQEEASQKSDEAMTVETGR
jgi:S1-C subfamily serine protease